MPVRRLSRESIGQRGLEIYQGLRPQLESCHYGRFVAIDVETGEYEVADDPRFVKPGDFRLQPGSPAIGAGATIPADWFDPLRDRGSGKPDAGAIPAGAKRLRVGRHGRLSF